MMRRLGLLLPALGAMFVLAGGGVHLREWLTTYRTVPADVPGAVVVRSGFLVNVAVSAVVAALVLVAAAVRMRRRSRWWLPVVVGAIVFEAANVVALILSRNGGFGGWSEEGWGSGATAALTVELTAVLLLGLSLAAVPALAARWRLPYPAGAVQPAE